MVKGIRAKDIRDFIKACEKLDSIMVRIHEYQPDAQLFVAGEGETTFNLTVGLDDAEGMGNRNETVVENVTVRYADCGGW